MRVATIGAITGFITFLVFALKTAMAYGGYAGSLLAGGIFGSPIPNTLLPKMLVIFGMALGVVGISFLFIVIGAVIGTLISCIKPRVFAKNTI